MAIVTTRAQNYTSGMLAHIYGIGSGPLADLCSWSPVIAGFGLSLDLSFQFQALLTTLLIPSCLRLSVSNVTDEPNAPPIQGMC